jgi:hypothetical protein
MEMIQCPKCASGDLPAYAERHAAIHARQERDYAEAVRLDAAITAAYGPVRPAQ